MIRLGDLYDIRELIHTVNPDRARRCGYKIRHLTQVHAEHQLDSLRRSGKDPSPGTLRVYNCWYCHGFHVGHYQSRPQEAEAV